jgi:hypothetical protein
VLMSLPDDSDKICVFSDVTNINCVGGIGISRHVTWEPGFSSLHG